MGAASAYEAVLAQIEKDVQGLISTNPQIFTFNNVANGFVEIRDFQTTGVVAFAKGQPFSKVQVGKQTIGRSEEHTSELQSLMRISYAVFCLKKKKTTTNRHIVNANNKMSKLHS